jgi:tetratricopeptide (TPR) repeat protein
MTDSTNTKELVQRGRAAASVGRLGEAREYLKRAAELSPEDVEIWLTLAAVENDPARKIECFETILELDPDNIEAQLGLDMLRDDAETAAAPDRATEDELEAVMAQASWRLEEAVGPPPAGEVPLDDAARLDDGAQHLDGFHPEDGVLYCANHPNVETMLRCNRCRKPICTRCAVQTPVGYRCRECVGAQQASFYTGGALDYVIGAVIAVVLGAIAAYLMTLLGAWFFALILGPTIGIGIAELVRRAVGRRRSRYLWIVVAGGLIVGALPALLLALNSLWALIALGLFLLLAVGAATARLR